MSRVHVAAVRSTPGWQADLHLKFGVRPHLPAKGAGPEAGRTRLVERHHKGPLIVQRPFYPEGDPCHVYLVHPPGGVVGGDELRIDAQVDAGAHVLMTTPAATKFYRCEGRISSQTQELRAAGATLEWLPQENIFYCGADVHTATRFHLDTHSRLIGWEINCLGLPARGEPFDKGTLRLDLELWRSRVASESGDVSSGPIFLDRMRLTGDSRSRGACWGLAGQEAVGTLLATPATHTHVEAVRELVAGESYAAVSLVDGVLVLRALAPQAAAVRKLFISAWQRLRPDIVGRPAVLPRIWNT